MENVTIERRLLETDVLLRDQHERDLLSFAYAKHIIGHAPQSAIQAVYSKGFWVDLGKPCPREIDKDFYRALLQECDLPDYPQVTRILKARIAILDHFEETLARDVYRCLLMGSADDQDTEPMKPVR